MRCKHSKGLLNPYACEGTCFAFTCNCCPLLRRFLLFKQYKRKCKCIHKLYKVGREYCVVNSLCNSMPAWLEYYYRLKVWLKH